MLALEQVDGLAEVGGADIFGQRGVLAFESQIHLPGDAAIAEVAGGRRAELADVLSFSEVHFEQTANARCKRKQVEGCSCSFRRGTGGDFSTGGIRGFDGRLVLGQNAAFFL